MDCSFFEIEASVKIENMFLLPDRLVVVSKTSVYEADVKDSPRVIKHRQVFNNRLHLKTDRVIKDVEHKHDSLYMMIRNDEDTDTTFCRYSLDGSRKVMVCPVPKKVDRFEVSFKRELDLFLVCQRSVFQYTLQEALGSLRRHLRLNVLKGLASPKPKTRPGSKFKKVYSNKINKISFFKFDSKMKYFFTHDDNMIKKCLFATGEDVFTFLDKRARVRNVWFTGDLSIMIK